ncbi:MAG: Gfo/Idh/MocA family oxidoreductase [Aliishimia sp.]
MTRPAPYKVAVVGLGYFSAFHIAAWQKINAVRLVSATDPDPKRRVWAADKFGLAVADSLKCVLENAPDIIDIVAPPAAHAGVIRASLAQGRTLICQKPFCTSLTEADAVTREARKAGTRIIIHENFRFQPWYRAMQGVIISGELGEIYAARFALRPGDGRGENAYLGRQPAFQTMPKLLIHETGVHFIDLFRWLLGDVVSVYADLRRLNPVIKGEDAGLLVMEHATGARSTFDGNRLSDHVSDNPRRTMGEMVIEGEKGTLSLDGAGRVWKRDFGAQDAIAVDLPFRPDDSFGGGCVAALIRHVVEALQGKCAFENEASAYLPVIALTDLAYASDAAGRKLKT